MRGSGFVKATRPFRFAGSSLADLNSDGGLLAATVPAVIPEPELAFNM